MEGSFDVEEDSSQAAKLTVRVELQMEWLAPAAADRVSGGAGRGKDTWQALQETEEAGRRAGVRQDGRCLLVLSSLSIWSNLPLVLLSNFLSEEND